LSAREQLKALDGIHRRFETDGVEYWLFGGWAVDFHAGTVTRPHGDIDVAIWLGDLSVAARLLHDEGWVSDPGAAEDGSTAFTRGAIRLEVAFLEREDGDSEPYTPLAGGRRAAWAAGAFGRDILTLAGVQARVITLPALRKEKTGPRDDPAAAAKDRDDRATLARRD
jgi:hypothetical protein